MYNIKSANLELTTNDLLTAHGFCDGDLIDYWWDQYVRYIPDYIRYQHLEKLVFKYHHEILIEIVKKWLIPALRKYYKNIDIDLFYCIHSPITIDWASFKEPLIDLRLQIAYSKVLALISELKSKYRIGGYFRERVCPKCKKKIFFKEFFYNNFSLGIKRCSKLWNSHSINYKCQDCFFNKKNKKLKENVQYFEEKKQHLERSCFKCKYKLTFKDFYSVNKEKGKKACEQKWNLPQLQFFCCFCYREELRLQLGMTPVTISIL